MSRLSYTTVEVTFRVCPFCAEHVNVLEIPATFTSWPDLTKGFVVDCKSMGCIMPRTRPFPTADMLRDEWNTRLTEDW